MTEQKNNNHTTVLLQEAVAALEVKSGHWYVDATFGRGGHTKAIMAAGGNVIAFDFDDEAIQQGETLFAQEIADGRLVLVRENFDHLESEVTQQMQQHNIASISGVLFDFGTSTEQLTSQERGFSFQGDGPLDMRMDNRLSVQAKDLLAVIPSNQLAQLFLEKGGETEAKAIARAIKASPAPIATVRQLSELISRIKRRSANSRIHPATKVFQALRIAVNTELENIERALPQSLSIVADGGRIVTIAFHEGEDGIVKSLFKHWQANNKGKSEYKKPLAPSEQEIAANQRARSAKMRVFTKGATL